MMTFAGSSGSEALRPGGPHRCADRLIDLIVYRLYGLMEEEVAVVEGSI